MTITKKRRNLVRSRAGCDGCRRRKKKCDELKPKCSACIRLGVPCSYLVRLNWQDCNQKVLVDELLESTALVEKFHFLSYSLKDIQLYLHQKGTTEAPTTTKYIMRANRLHKHREYQEDAGDLDVESKLFEYYVEVISKKKVFSDSELNEFRSVVIPGCISNPALFHSIMAVSASDILRKNPEKFNYYSGLITKYKNEAINLMYNLLDNPDIKCMKTIAITLLILCSLEIGEKGNESWVGFLEEGCMIMESLAKEKIMNSEDLLFAYRYFALRYILLLTTFSRKQFVEFTTKTPFRLIDEFFHSNEVDYMLGCSPKLLKIVHGITVLRNQAEDNPGHETIAAIKQLHQELKSLKQYNCDGQRLDDCAQVYYSAAIIYFINCFHQYVDIRMDTAQLMESSLQTFSTMASDNSTLNLFPTWALFMLSVAIPHDESEKFRAKVLEVFDQMEAQWPLGSVTTIRQTVEMIWKHTDLTVDEASRLKLDWQAVLDLTVVRLAMT